jgi:hypothetical protein
MADSASSHQFVLPKLPIMLSTSEDTRTGVLSSMGSQYQCLLQAVSLSSLHISSLDSPKHSGIDRAREKFKGQFDKPHISTRSKALSSPDTGPSHGPSSTTAPPPESRTTDAATSSPRAEKSRLKWVRCKGSLSWKTASDHRRYKCSKCNFRIKKESKQDYFLEFATKDGFKIRIDNEELWASHEKMFYAGYQWYVCKLCTDDVFGWYRLEMHLK